MKVAILHLSDIHLAKESDPIFSRYEQIANAISSNITQFSELIIAVSGDIANFGTKAEYNLAGIFFNNLKNAISSRSKNISKISFVFIPGNHDCNFSNAQDVEIREDVLSNLSNKISTLTPQSGSVKQCISIQTDFFEFVSEFTQTPIIPEENRLCYVIDIPNSNKNIRFRCYNTAWVTQKSEIQGQMLFPTSIAKTAQEEETNNADLVVTLFHHPYNWLEHTNAHTFSQFVEQNSDIVLTGHEHINDSYLKEKITGEKVRYIAGDVLQERNTSISGFNLVLIDLETKTQKFIQYKWDTNHYSIRQDIDWFRFQRNRFLVSKGFVNNEKFANVLQEVGTEYLHPYKKKGTLTLKDIFVYPDLKELTLKGKTIKNDLVGMNNIVNHLGKKKYTIIYGDDNSGKTSLAKTLYTDFQAQELVPLMLCSTNKLNGDDDGSLRDCLNSAIEEQYSSSLRDAFYQLDPKKKVLIIDDFHKFRLNGKSQRNLLNIAQLLFDIIIVFASDIYQLQSLVEQNDEAKAILTFTPFKIKEYGRKLRGQIVRKWLKLGREMSIAPKELSHEENQLEHVLNGIISKNVIPAYPFWIISILQMWKSEQSNNGNFGAFGYIYDGLITKQLEELGYDATKIDKIYTFLGRIAYFLFSNEQSSFDLNDLSKIGDDYFKLYKVRINVYELAEKLRDARILRELDESYSFTQPYILYFFIARYIKENLAANVDAIELRKKVLEMIEHIAYEPYSYILLILVYLTKDLTFIEKIIESAQQIFVELSPSDLNKDVEFLNKISPKLEPLALPSSDFEKNRDDYRETLDELDDEDDIHETLTDKNSSQMVKYRSDLDDLTKMVIAMRHIELMGQILRNFPGSLMADIKLKLAQELYLLGLRLLQAFLKIAEESIDSFREYYSQLIKEGRPQAKSQKALEADSLVIWLASGASFGIIKKISVAVGHEDLQETYIDVKSSLRDLISVEMIDLSIKLDHFKGVPHSQIEALAKKLKDNKFSYGILRDLIVHFLYMFHVVEQDRQKLLSKFEIGTSQAPPLLGDSKRTRKRGSKNRKTKVKSNN